MGFEFGGMKAYPKNATLVQTLKDDTTDVRGLAYDHVRKKIYYSTQQAIHWMSPDGSGDERLFASEECETTHN